MATDLPPADSRPALRRPWRQSIPLELLAAVLHWGALWALAIVAWTLVA